jgi:hypothetical protein
MINEYTIMIFLIALFILIKLTYQDIKNDRKISALDVKYLAGFTSFYFIISITKIIPAIITITITIVGTITLCKILQLADGDQEVLISLNTLLTFTGYYNITIFITTLIILDLAYKTYNKIVHPTKEYAPYLPIILTTWIITHLILIM